MPNVARLGKGASKKVSKAIDTLFDNAKARLLGPQSIIGKKIFIGYTREMSLPGIFEAGSLEEMVKPDMDVLDSLIRVAGAYVDAHRERTKARVIHEINGAMAEAKHNGGMSQSDFRGLVNTKLASVWGDVTRNIHSVVDTELSHAKNVSVLDGVVGANLNAGVSDPVVYFVVVRDNILCKECKRLHLMDDEKTPRLWYLSELGHGYHKKGEDSPKIGGLHPHCRCTLVTLLPSFGFTGDGMVKYVKRGHLELPKQRGLALSESYFGIPLSKTWDPDDHPRGEDGEFISDETFDPSLDPDLTDPSYEEEDAQVQRGTSDDAVDLIRDMMDQGVLPLIPAQVEQALKAMGGWPDDETGLKNLRKLGVLYKAQRAPSRRPTSELGKRIQQQAFREILANPLVTSAPRIYKDFNHLLRMWKLGSTKPASQLLRYKLFRMLNVDGYDTPEGAAALDTEFQTNLDKLNEWRSKATRGSGEALAIEDVVPLYDLRKELAHNAFCFDGLVAHKETVQQKILSQPDKLIHRAGEDFPRVVLHRGLTVPTRHKDLLPASYSDTLQVIGGRVRWHHLSEVPVSNILIHVDAADPKVWSDLPRRHTENELVVAPHPIIKHMEPVPVGTKPDKVPTLKKLIEQPAREIPSHWKAAKRDKKAPESVGPSRLASSERPLSVLTTLARIRANTRP